MRFVYRYWMFCRTWIWTCFWW